MTAIVSCRGVTKRYRQQLALDNLDIDVPEGRVFGLLGPNGAGKTTLIKILLGLVSPTRGAIDLFGADLFRHRNRAIRQVGAVVEAPIFFEYMSAWDNLRYLVALSGRVAPARLREALAIVGLTDAAEKKVGAYSYGMKQRLGIAQALLPESRLLILDEPTNGLDPHGIAGVRDLIQTLTRRHGITVFLSSHLLSEVEQVCERVVIINRGRKVLEGDVADLQRQTGVMTVRARAGEAAATALTAAGATAVTAEGDSLMAQFDRRPENAPELIRNLVAAGLDLLEVQPLVRTLEDIFIEHTATGPADVRIDTIRTEEITGSKKEPDGAA